MTLVGEHGQQTKRRIFDAATAEFTAHGIAGARVDRIAAAADANKQRIYAYFKNKRHLFEEVVSEHVSRLIHEVPFDASDLPTWAGRTFDFYAKHPEVPQLLTWHSLEPGESRHRIPIVERAIKERTRQVEQAQAAGIVSAALPAPDVLAIVNAIARSWAIAPPERSPRRGVGPAVLKRRRASVVEVVRRLTAP